MDLMILEGSTFVNGPQAFPSQVNRPLGLRFALPGPLLGPTASKIKHFIYHLDIISTSSRER